MLIFTALLDRKKKKMSLLTIKDLSHDFRDKIWYKNVNFKVFKNEHIIILGANGAGNSILMKLLTGESMAKLFGILILKSPTLINMLLLIKNK